MIIIFINNKAYNFLLALFIFLLNFLHMTIIRRNSRIMAVNSTAIMVTAMAISVLIEFFSVYKIEVYNVM